MSEETTNQTPDLDKLRDEKCFPVVRDIMRDMAESLIPPDAGTEVDYNPIILKLLRRTLDADMNITTENPYLFQVILGVLSGLNTTVPQCSMAPIDDVRYGKIEAKILDILASSNIRLGKVTPDEIAEDFVPVKAQLEALFAHENLSMLEVKYVMDRIFECFRDVQGLFAQNVAMSVERMEAKILGVEHMSDLTMKRLDTALTTPIEASKTE